MTTIVCFGVLAVAWFLHEWRFFEAEARYRRLKSLVFSQQQLLERMAQHNLKIEERLKELQVNPLGLQCN